MKLTLLPEEHSTAQKCPICTQVSATPKLSINNAPQILGCATKGRDDQFISFNAWSCNHCHFISTDASPEDMAYELLHSEALGPTWDRHKKTLASYCNKILEENTAETANYKMLELGPSSSPLAYAMGRDDLTTTFIDLMPDAPFDLSHQDTYIQAMFPEKKPDQPCDIIAASHVFEHVEDMYSFLIACKDLLSNTGSIILSIPNFEVWLGNKYWNAITPEHINYPTRKHLKILADRIGMHVSFDHFETHSLFIRLTHLHTSREEKSPISIESQDDLLLPWAQSILSSIKAAEEKLKTALSQTSSQCIAIAGASHIAQYPCLMSDYLSQNVTMVIDNSKIKHGKRLYGCALQIHAFEDLANFETPIILLFNSPYREEMKKQINSINPNAICLNI